MTNSFSIRITVDSLDQSLYLEKKEFMASFRYTVQQLELEKTIAIKTSSIEIYGNKEWDNGVEIPKEKYQTIKVWQELRPKKDTVDWHRF